MCFRSWTGHKLLCVCYMLPTQALTSLGLICTTRCASEGMHTICGQTSYHALTVGLFKRIEMICNAFVGPLVNDYGKLLSIVGCHKVLTWFCLVWQPRLMMFVACTLSHLST
jgi:hypothetical protein